MRYGTSVVANANADLRAAILVDEYRRRRRTYDVSARQLGLVYDTKRVRERTGARLTARGIRPRRRTLGGIHTLAYLPLVGWHTQLLQPLGALGPLSHFDNASYGLDYVKLIDGDAGAIQARQHMSEIFLRYAQRVSREHRVDWVFTYASALELLPEVIDQVRSITNAPVVGMCFDDKQSWSGPVIGGLRCGQVPIASKLDLAWTSARVACEWYMVEGGNPILLPEGCNPNSYSPADVRQDIEVCFVGQAYGQRPRFVAKLKRLGVQVHAVGPGWPAGVLSDPQVVELFRRSKIILGSGGIGWSRDLKNVKGRDFDAPAVGNAPYLTSFNPELADYFDLGKEVLCYSCEDECVDQIRWLLSDEPRRLAIARAGRRRCLAEHTWIHRFTKILQVLDILEE
jgi:hypothetical protein